MRERDAVAPAAIVTGLDDAALVLAAAEHNATFIPKGDPVIAEKAVRAFAAEAREYERRRPPSKLPPGITDVQVAGFKREVLSLARKAGLTPTETEVLLLYVLLHTTAEITAKLGLKEPTVRTHCAAIKLKTGRTVGELAPTLREQALARSGGSQEGME
jgi:DNA-binding CsgD family transcriptional regulator